MKSKNNSKENYLDKIPAHNPNFNWTCDEKGIVTIEIENKGIINRIFQKLFKKPKITYIHLDEIGSYIWQKTDGIKDITALGQELKADMGDKAEPLYERMAKYFQILDSYGFIEFK